MYVFKSWNCRRGLRMTTTICTWITLSLLLLLLLLIAPVVGVVDDVAVFNSDPDVDVVTAQKAVAEMTTVKTDESDFDIDIAD